ncbi:MAG: hypothetical protein JXB30_06290 [Anaerolineae bacterium]|nr:hypothetical protein [Anaerolineae bacterium]
MKRSDVRIYAGVFFLALSLLMLEVTLTRIFSVVLYYHFAVLSISLALFGSAAAGVAVYLFPNFFRKQRMEALLTVAALAYSISVVATFVIFIRLPLLGDETFLTMLELAYLDLALPFFFGGLCLTLALSSFASKISMVYFFDLVGAALGCLLALWLLDLLGGPGTVMVVAVIGALASAVFGFRLRFRYPTIAWLALAVAILSLQSHFDMFRLVYVKGGVEPQYEYERWNSFSRVTVAPEEREGPPFGWGLSTARTYENPGWMSLTIDAMAQTPIIRFDGDWSSVDFLKSDVSSLVYYLRGDSSVLIIGPGGGRDVLSALLFGAESVDGVELNPLIVDAVRVQFADYAGHIYADPRVHIYVDDGRNFLAKSSKHYDVIQASAVDTWAATAAGAFALSENNLYTLEAFQTYRERLTPEGILAFSRYVFPGDYYGETLRLTGLALEAWRLAGIDDPSAHLIVVGNLNEAEDSGYVTLLMKYTPFTLEEVEQVEKISAPMDFKVLYAPFGRGYGVVRDMVTTSDIKAYWDSYPIDISPPTDDRPFFFQMLRLSDIPRLGLNTILSGQEAMRLMPIATLGMLLAIVTFLVLVFILAPMWLTRRRAGPGKRGSRFLLAYFACLGIGFMMVEVGLVQKFVLFLGHPTYSLAVVLSSLLLSSGLGSFATRQIEPSSAARMAGRIGAGLIFLLPVYILFLPYLESNFMGLGQPAKIAISLCGLFPLGLLMGCFFPLGIKIAVDRRWEAAIPWYWALNGATSVFASVFAIAVGLQYGMRAELMGGWLSYLAAACILLIFARKRPRVPSEESPPSPEPGR